MAIIGWATVVRLPALGLTLLGLAFWAGLAAIVCGGIALTDTKNDKSNRSIRAEAITGIVFGGITFAMVLVFITIYSLVFASLGVL